MVATAKLKIINKAGLHARASTKFVQLANKYRCNVTVGKDDQEVNGKSIMGLMMLAAAMGSKVKFIATGEDAAQLLTELEALFAKKFDEA